MFSILIAQAPAPAPGAGGGLLNILPFVLMFVVAYYVMIRPQMRRQKDQARLVSALKTGDKVVTAYKNQHATPLPASTFDFTPPTDAQISQPLGK